MHKSPNQIVRSVARVPERAQTLSLFRSVSISFGPDTCDAARSQDGVEYMGMSFRVYRSSGVRGQCDCKYVPSGTDHLHRLDAAQKSGTRSSS